MLGIPVADLSAAALSDKLVHRRRGGYCYEHNGLMGYVLDELGFGVERLAGRVVWMNPDGPAQTLTVHLSGGAALDGAQPQVVINAHGLPYLDPKLPVAKRVADLLSRMTLAEKIGQMTQAERGALDAPARHHDLRPRARCSPAAARRRRPTRRRRGPT